MAIFQFLILHLAVINFWC